MRSYHGAVNCRIRIEVLMVTFRSLDMALLMIIYEVFYYNIYITGSQSDGSGTSRSYQSPVSRRTNDLLFNHIMTDLDKHPNTYEMELTPDECTKFMKQVSI